MCAVRVDVLRRAAFAGGHAFEGGGIYETIDARLQVCVDAGREAARNVFDMDLAPRSGDGTIEFSLDIFALAPVEQARRSGVTLVEFPNRGNKRCLQFLNDAPATNDPRALRDAGNGYLMRQGHVVICAAWQGDVLFGDRRLTCDLPVARQADGSAPTATVRAEFICDVPGVKCLPLSGKWGTRSLPAVSTDTGAAELRRRRYPDTPAEIVDARRWSFARIERGSVLAGGGDVVGGETALVPSDRHVHLPGGFEPGWIYELVYTATDPLVLDLGFVGVREMVSALRHGEAEGDPLELCAGPRPVRVVGWGRSQAGRAIRDFIHRGFNEDEHGRKVFDGMISHIAGGGRTSMQRFSNLVVPASRQYEDNLNPADRFPFAYATSRDRLTGETDGILKRPATDPLVFHTQSASEYWYRRGSLVHTDTEGNDLAEPDGVRVYLWASSQHWADPRDAHPQKGICANYQNIVATSALFRGSLAMMIDWIDGVREPPPSRVPRVADGTLVPMETWREGFPAIPGTALPRGPNRLPLVDYGPAFAAGGPVVEPPTVDPSREYPVMVPAVDADGNDRAGVRAPTVAAPLGTYTGWNLRTRGHGAGALHDFSGSYIPFPESREEREATGDPRPAILERYADAGAYVEAVRRAAEALAAEGFLLAEDVARAAEQARAWGCSRHVTFIGEDDAAPPATITRGERNDA